MRTSIMAAAVMAVAIGGYAAYRTNDNFRSWIDSRMATSAAPQAAPRKRASAPVRVAKTTQRDVPVILEGVGNVQALSTVQVKSRIDGQLFEAAVEDGHFVEKGDLLFRLDDRPLVAQLRQAEANLGRDQANLDKARSDVVRLKSLAAKGISPQTRLEEAQSSLAALESTVRASEAAVEIARLNVEYAAVRAPISGRVGTVLLSPGNMVKANDTQPMLVITQTKPVNVAFALPEKYVAELRERMRGGEPLLVDVTVPGSKASGERGRLFFLNNVIDTASGTIQVMARFENKAELLMPGQFARAEVTLQVLANAVVAPSRAIQINQKGHYAWVVKGDLTVEARSIEIGPRSGTETVVLQGLGAGETIVTDGQLRLFPGAGVQPINANGKDKKTNRVQS
ncbi:MAG: efflux RND transporter periplasmic adaptor subunit [Alphaproteobacteria bacterium]|nr:efflux RND transporter periplasmic adaptor subunit [Alphaproteobacteria bacterium]